MGPDSSNMIFAGSGSADEDDGKIINPSIVKTYLDAVQSNVARAYSSEGHALTTNTISGMGPTVMRAMARDANSEFSTVAGAVKAASVKKYTNIGRKVLDAVDFGGGMMGY